MKALPTKKIRWIKFFSISMLYMLLVIADNYTTYLYTPDLALEANPLVSLLGFSWKSLIIEDVFAIIFFSLFVYFPFVHYKRSVIQCKGFKEYILLFNKGKFSGLALIGYMIAAAGIASRIYVNINAFMYMSDFSPCILCLLNKSHTYCNTIVLNVGNGQVIIPFVMISAIVIIGLISGFFWLHREYKINKNALLETY